MDTDLTGRVAIVTGGSRNIGRAIAAALAGAGARVAIGWETGTAKAKEAVEEITRAGGSAMDVHIDLTDLDSIHEAVGTIERAWRTPDIVINNAAVRPQHALADVTSELWDKVFAVNVKGSFFLVQRILPTMVAQRWGRIITLGGLHGYIGSNDRAHVHASKFAAVGMMRGIAYDTATHGITANVVVPGRIQVQRGPVELYGTELPPDEAATKVLMQRRGQPQDVANMCLFLASDRASYITGQEYFVTGGTFPLVPGL